jgi:hypothetical protein
MTDQTFPIDDYLNIDTELALLLFPQNSGISREQATKLIDKMSRLVIKLAPDGNTYVSREQVVKYTCAKIGAIILNHLKLYSGWKSMDHSDIEPNHIRFGWMTIWTELVDEITHPINLYEQGHCLHDDKCTDPKCSHSVFVSAIQGQTHSSILEEAVNLWNQSNDKSKYSIYVEESPCAGTGNYGSKPARFQLGIKISLNEITSN